MKTKSILTTFSVFMMLLVSACSGDIVLYSGNLIILGEELFIFVAIKMPYLCGFWRFANA
ncbi:hypothetical protein SAMN02910398_01350 [Butyrivibrio sp. YAB3001]|nr:hypothetical protein SAMN02910398_01350 [Butyrivibrio sp. YAB3001]